jgi:copper chaperone NosL
MGLALAAGTAALLAVAALRLAAPPSGPAAVAWDRTACAHCRMLLSEPRFAAQLVTQHGETLFFDDPGCLVRWRTEHPGEASAAWFHDSRSERWLAEAETRFVPGEVTPMAYGYAAVPRSAELPGALDAAALLAALEARQ